MILNCKTNDISECQEWLQQQAMNVKLYNGNKPSEIENLNKETWQSDRNLGMCGAVCDTYQATLLSTCLNPNSIHFVPTEENDIKNKENLAKFAQWDVNAHEDEILNEVDDWLHNFIVGGYAVFHSYWKVWYQWVDKRVPKYGPLSKLVDNVGKKFGDFQGYEIKTERVRFEKPVTENVANTEDIIAPKFGKSLQHTSHLIHVLHVLGGTVLDRGERGLYVNVDLSYEGKLKGMVKTSPSTSEGQAGVRNEALGVKDVSISDLDVRLLPVDLYNWYGPLKRKGKLEEYRLTIDPVNEVFLAGKPLRKVTRSGERPFDDAAFIRVPGHLRGKGLTHLTAPETNAINLVYNQTADLQTQENLQTGFYNPEDEYLKGEQILKPGKLIPAEKPENVVFPMRQRTHAWNFQMINLLFEILEKKTGAASYFLTSQSKNATATRDNIVSERSENRFSLWVKRAQGTISKTLNRRIQMYQDWAPPDLGKRVLGKDGNSLIKNFSINSIRGNYDLVMSPNVTAGSKTLDKEIKIWAYQNTAQSPWMSPELNPKGSWKQLRDLYESIGIDNPEQLLPPEPPDPEGRNEDIDNELVRIKQGEQIDPPERGTPMILQHLMGHQRQNKEARHEIDEEYLPNWDKHIFLTELYAQKFIKQAQQTQIANGMARDQIMQGGMGQQPVSAPMGAPQAEEAMIPQGGEL